MAAAIHLGLFSPIVTQPTLISFDIHIRFIRLISYGYLMFSFRFLVILTAFGVGPAGAQTLDSFKKELVALSIQLAQSSVRHPLHNAHDASEAFYKGLEACESGDLKAIFNFLECMRRDQFKGSGMCRQEANLLLATVSRPCLEGEKQAVQEWSTREPAQTSRVAYSPKSQIAQIAYDFTKDGPQYSLLEVNTVSSFIATNHSQTQFLQAWHKIEKQGETTRLLLPIKTYEHKSGQMPTVTLVAASHLASPQYFSQHQIVLDSMDLVLYELPFFLDENTSQACRELFNRYVETSNKEFGLAEQYSSINYNHPNFIQADLPFGLLFSGDLRDESRCHESLESVAKHEETQKPSQNENRKTLLEGDPLWSLPTKAEFAILHLRESYVFALLSEIFDSHQSGDVAVLYGASHMPRIEAFLLSAGYAQKTEQWLEVLSSEL